MSLTEFFPTLPMQQWSIDNSAGDVATKFVNWVVIDDVRVDPVRYTRCLREMVAETESLRAGFALKNNKWVQYIAAPTDALVRLRQINRDGCQVANIQEIVSHHINIIENTTGNNIGVIDIGSMYPGKLILLLNHFFLDFYSVAWVVRSASLRYSALFGESVKVPKTHTGYQEFCCWLDQQARNPSVLDAIIHRLASTENTYTIPPSLGAIVAPLLWDAAETQYHSCVTNLTTEAKSAFYFLQSKYSITSYILGLALILYIEAKFVSQKGAFYINIKESGRGLFPQNTIDLPCFLAATSRVKFDLVQSMSIDDHIPSIIRQFAGNSRVIDSSALFSVADQDPLRLGYFDNLPPAQILYNAVDFRAFGGLSTGDEEWGVFRSKGYRKREGIEIRFIFMEERIDLLISARKGFNIDAITRHYSVLLHKVLNNINLHTIFQKGE